MSNSCIYGCDIGLCGCFEPFFICDRNIISGACVLNLWLIIVIVSIIMLLIIGPIICCCCCPCCCCYLCCRCKTKHYEQINIQMVERKVNDQVSLQINKIKSNNDNDDDFDD